MQNKTKVHDLKVWKEFFKDLETKKKTFEVRKNDRNFQVGDLLMLMEYNKETDNFTGRYLEREIVFKFDGGQFGLEAGFCVLGIK